MESEEIRSLLQQAVVQADPKSGGLSDYRDLQELLRKVIEIASSLLEERDQLRRRLRRRFEYGEEVVQRHAGAA